MDKKLVVISLILAALSVSPATAEAAGSSLYFSPNSGGFFVGSTFDVGIFVNTGGEDINAVEVNLKFDPAKLQIASPTAGKSFIEVWVAQPAYSNTQGIMSFIGGIPSPGINTSAGLVSTVTFRVISPGETLLSFLDSTKVLRNDAAGTNVLTSKGRAAYRLLIPPPEGPKVFSLTHSDANKWYKNNNPTFSWDKEEGINTFSYSFDNEPNGIPDNEAEGEHSSVSYGEVADGIWYFHVKAEKDGVWGGTSHFVVQIDASSPAVFEPVVEPAAKTIVKQPLVSFITTDALSGMDHYEFKYIDITKDKEQKPSGFFVEVATPHRVPLLEEGRYLIVIRAYDKAGNWREGTAKVQIFPEGFSLNKEGIQYQIFFIPWWFLILILILIIIILIYLLRRRQMKNKDKEGERLAKIKKMLKEKTKTNDEF
ncbi:MAG: cohesin domain-containing protein [bacterium]